MAWGRTVLVIRNWKSQGILPTGWETASLFVRASWTTLAVAIIVVTICYVSLWGGILAYWVVNCVAEDFEARHQIEGLFSGTLPWGIGLLIFGFAFRWLMLIGRETFGLDPYGQLPE
jgi:hypothetical protein